GAAALVLSEQMIERLILRRAPLGRYRLIPFLGVVEHRIDVENHAAKRIKPVTHDLTDREFTSAEYPRPVHDRPPDAPCNRFAVDVLDRTWRFIRKIRARLKPTTRRGSARSAAQIFAREAKQFQIASLLGDLFEIFEIIGQRLRAQPADQPADELLGRADSLRHRLQALPARQGDAQN